MNKHLYFYEQVELQVEENKVKFGKQDIRHLLLVCQDQLGQMTSEYLTNGSTPKFRLETIHLAAVLPAVYEQTIVGKEK